jgi:hypothetical protein
MIHWPLPSARLNPIEEANMAKVIATGRVQDPVKWEAGFRTHGSLFQSMTVRDTIHYAMNGNEITVLVDVESLEMFQRVMESQAVADAMAHDGVERETVKMVVLDQEMKLATAAA